jgi:hypothetical protein
MVMSETGGLKGRGGDQEGGCQEEPHGRFALSDDVFGFLVAPN